MHPTSISREGERTQGSSHVVHAGVNTSSGIEVLSSRHPDFSRFDHVGDACGEQGGDNVAASNTPRYTGCATEAQWQDTTVPDLVELIRDTTKVYTEAEKTAAWNKASTTVKKYSDELVEQWNREIDGLLTFAGLFSAILTAFNVQSYQLLQPAPGDQTNTILVHMSAQIEGFRFAPPFLNSTRPPFDPTTQPPFKAPLYAIWLNVLWFTSLVFSLASATIGIVVKQWLREYSTGLYGTSPDIARRRQYRYDNLQKWHVATIVAVIPVLLLIASILFLSGLVVLLYSINDTVAQAVSVFVGPLLLFVVVTTVLPTLSRSCCYYSPQARALFSLRNVVVYTFGTALALSAATLRLLFGWLAEHPTLGTPFYSTCHLYFRTFLEETHLRWKIPRIWRRDEVSSFESTNLNISILATAYSSTLDVAILDNSITCLSDNTNLDFLNGYMYKLEKSVTARSGPQGHWPDPVFNRVIDTAEAWLRLSLAPIHAINQGVVQEDLIKRTKSMLATLVRRFDLLPRRGLRSPSDAQIRLRALSSMSREIDTTGSDKAWLWMLRQCDTDNIRDPVTHKIVAAVAADRMRSFVRDPLLGCPHPQRHVAWDLQNSILDHLSVIGQLLKNPTGSEDTIKSIRPFIADALRSVEKLLVGMEWARRTRNLYLEGTVYCRILQQVEHVRHHEQAGDLVATSLVQALAEAFSRLIDGYRQVGCEASAGHSTIIQCSDILSQLGCSPGGIIIPDVQYNG